MNIEDIKTNFQSLILKLEKINKTEQLNYLIEIDDYINNIKMELPDNDINDIKDREYNKIDKDIMNKILPLSMLYYINNIDRIENINNNLYENPQLN